MHQSSTEFKRFSDEYFTGADVRIYFGDILIDEVIGIQFTLQENVAPIFGYASYTWDKVARGNRHIQGNFTINYKSSYYLHSILERLQSDMEEETDEESANFNEDRFSNGTNIEHLLSVNDKDFDELSNEFEKSLWGEGSNSSINDQRTARSKHQPFFYGSKEAKNSSKMRDSGFNILITYGPYNQKKGAGVGGQNVAGSAHSLVGVQLSSVDQIVGLNGQPIQEQYQFIARDLDGNVAELANKRPSTVASMGNYATNNGNVRDYSTGAPGGFQGPYSQYPEYY